MFDDIDDPDTYLDALIHFRSEVSRYAHAWQCEVKRMQRQYEEWQAAGLIDDIDLEMMSEKLQSVSAHHADTIKGILRKLGNDHN